MIYRRRVAIYDTRVYTGGTRTGGERAYLILMTLNMQIEFAHRNVWFFAENDAVSVRRRCEPCEPALSPYVDRARST